MKKILVTGGFGKIGRHFVQHFSDKYQIVATDLVTQDEMFSDKVKIHSGDLLNLEFCKKICEGIDTIVHLAGIPHPSSSFEEVLEANILTTRNIFQTAIDSNCRRLIFASSAQTIESYPVDIQIQEKMAVRPKNFYGVSKCFGEALAAYHAYNDGISAICLRIGAYEFPEDHQTMNSRDLSAFLHPDDMNQLLIGCIETENIQFDIFNAISNNRYKRLDITRAIEKVGYTPKADAFNIYNIISE